MKNAIEKWGFLGLVVTVFLFGALLLQMAGKLDTCREANAKALMRIEYFQDSDDFWKARADDFECRNKKLMIELLRCPCELQEPALPECPADEEVE